jgi:hypothetical protein
MLTGGRVRRLLKIRVVFDDDDATLSSPTTTTSELCFEVVGRENIRTDDRKPRVHPHLVACVGDSVR